MDSGNPPRNSDTVKTEEEVAKHQEISQKGEVNAAGIWYGVALPPEKESDISRVFVSKSEALQVIKKFPGSRFREFSSWEDANKFASVPVKLVQEQISSPAVPVSEGNVTAYKSLTSQELVQLRKLIEVGNKDWFLDRVWANPRYLINDVDGPTILQAGSHYNALHVAAKYKQTELFRAILNTISDLKFLGLFYSKDDMLKVRRSHLLDLYLNMPEKSLSETPLHFACKYGAVEILKILLSYTECERNKVNKYGLLPKDMVCEREKSILEDVKKKMQDMFQDQHFVPIFRDKDNVIPPIIGQPCSPDEVMKAVSGKFVTQKDPNLISCAFAGPMTHNDAEKFYLIWKSRKFLKKDLSYTPEIKKTLNYICKSDPVKGLERVGRKLSRDLATGWLEYWKIFDAWLDISSNEGLEVLEQHLRKMYIKKIICVPAKEEKATEEMETAPSIPVIEPADDNVLHFTGEEMELSDEEYFTPPETPKDGDISSPFVLASEIGKLFISGSELSTDDIDLYRGIEKTDVNPDLYPFVYMWKCLMEEELGSLFNPVSDVSCTPPQSAAALRRAMKAKRSSGARRTLIF